MSRSLFNGVSEQSRAGKHRQTDATALFKAERWRGAMYIAGYAVECSLKTKLMKTFDCHKLNELEAMLRDRGILPDTQSIFTHNLESLFKMTGSFDRLKNNKKLWKEFVLVNQWMPAWRYNADGANREDAKDFLGAVESVTGWIENNV